MALNKIETERLSKIKILHIVTNLDLGGAQSSVVGICEGLHNQGIDVRLAYSLHGGQPLLYHPVLLERLNTRGIPTYNIPCMVRNLSPLLDIKALLQLYMLIRKIQPDIVHTHMSKAGILGRIAAIIAGVPCIIHTIRGWSFYSTKKYALRYVYILLEQFCSRLTDKMLAVSNQQIHDGLRAGIGCKENYVVVRTGIVISQFDSVIKKTSDIRLEIGIPRNVQVVGTVMGLTEQKAPLDFIATCELISRCNNRIHFLIIGDGPLRHIVKSAITSKGLEDRFHLLGFRVDIPRLLALMDVFLLTSYWEGLPRVLMEAIAAHVPIVATDVGGVSELVKDGDSGFLALPGEIQHLAAHVGHLLKDPIMRRRIAAKAQIKLSTDFDLKTVIEFHIKLYTNLLRKYTICTIQKGL